MAELTGVAETLKVISEARQFYTDADVRKAYDAAARAIATAVRKEAPRSKYPVPNRGQLRRAITGRAFRIETWRRYGPGSYAQVTLRRYSPRRAPHANIIVAGRRALSARRNQRLRMITRGGRVVYPKRVAAVAPNDFWRRGVKASIHRVEERIITSLQRAWARRSQR